MLQLQPLFPLALGQVQLAPDPLDTALLLREILALRGQASGNPQEGCAWTGDLHGAWRLDRQPAFAPLIGLVLEQARAYLEAVGFDPTRVALHLQRCWPVVSEAGQVVGRHHHPNAHLSGVYYHNGDGSGSSGCLRLFPPSQPNELVPGLAVGHGGPLRADGDAARRWNAPWIDIAPGPACCCSSPPSSITRCWRTRTPTISATRSASTWPSPPPAPARTIRGHRNTWRLTRPTGGSGPEARGSHARHGADLRLLIGGEALQLLQAREAILHEAGEGEQQAIDAELHPPLDRLALDAEEVVELPHILRAAEGGRLQPQAFDQGLHLPPQRQVKHLAGQSLLLGGPAGQFRFHVRLPNTTGILGAQGLQTTEDISACFSGSLYD